MAYFVIERGHVRGYYSFNEYIHFSMILMFIQKIWFLIILVITALWVDKDTQTLVIFPLASMLEKVQKLQMNMMIVMEGNFKENAGVLSSMYMRKTTKRKETLTKSGSF